MSAGSQYCNRTQFHGDKKAADSLGGILGLSTDWPVFGNRMLGPILVLMLTGF